MVRTTEHREPMKHRSVAMRAGIRFLFECTGTFGMEVDS